MRVCRQCAGPMPEIVRDDALYCSTSCKLKAQRKRKKERAKQESEDPPCVFEPVAPFGKIEQLSFAFVKETEKPVASTNAPKTPESTENPAPASTAKESKPRSWLSGLAEKLKYKDGPSDIRPGQQSKGRGRDLI